MNYMSIQSAIPELTVYFDEPLANYTFTKTGGPGDVVVFPKSLSEVEQIITWVEDNELPLTVLGNASNLIVRDGGIRGVVMILTQMNLIEVDIDNQRLFAQGGATLIETTQVAQGHSLTGLEFACGIPGSIGGAIYMNAGAYDGEVCDVVTTVQAITRSGQLKEYTNADCQFSYRHSVFQENDDIILGVWFQLAQGDRKKIDARVEELTQLRSSKQPLEYPSCGSVFKRPVGHFTGKLIQDAGLQGHRIGGAEVSKKHAGFIVNIDQATATDYVELIAYIQMVIKDQFDVDLETEVRIIGEQPN